MEVKDEKLFRNNQIKVNKKILFQNNEILSNELNIKIDKDENINTKKKKNLSTINKKRKIEKGKETKLIICKSEAKYPLTFRKNKSNSMKDLFINYSPYKTKSNLRFKTISQLYSKNTKGKKIINKKLIYNSGDCANNNLINKNYNKYNFITNKKNKKTVFPLEYISNMTFNNFKNFYKPIKSHFNDIENYYYDNTNLENDYNSYQNMTYVNKTSSRREEYYKNDTPEIKIDKIRKDEDSTKLGKIKNYKKKELLEIYKEKLVKIFVKFMNNFYIQYYKRVFIKLIKEFKIIEKDILVIKSNGKNSIIKIDKNENKKIYIKNKNKDNNNLSNINKNQIKTLSSERENSLKIYQKIKSKNFNKIKKRYSKENNKRIIKKNISNIYVPTKNRKINNYYNNILHSFSKIDIFNNVKIDKTSRINEINKNSLNHQKTNFDNTIYNRFYNIKKPISFNSINNINKKIYIKKINDKNKFIKDINNVEDKTLNYNQSTTKIKNNYNSEGKINDILEILENNININLNSSNDSNNYCLNDKPMSIIFLNNNMNMPENMLNTNYRKKIKNKNSFAIKNLMKTNTLDKRLFINFNFMNINNYIKKDYQFHMNDLFIIKNNSFNISYQKKNIIHSARIKFGILKLDRIINNNIFKNKLKFMKYLKIKKFFLFLLNIFKNKYFNKLKKNTKIKTNKKTVHFSFKNMNQTDKKIDNKINKNINFKFIAESGINSENNFIEPKKINSLQGKEKLKFLIKQINKTNNLKELNNQFENEKNRNKNKKCGDVSYYSKKVK